MHPSLKKTRNAKPKIYSPVVWIFILVVLMILAATFAQVSDRECRKWCLGHFLASKLLIFAALTGFGGGLWAGVKINEYPKKWRGSLLAYFTVFISVGVFAAWVYMHRNNYFYLRPPAYDASARSAGRNAKIAEDVYSNEDGWGGKTGTYTSNLNELLKIDRNLTDDRHVTFVFLHASESGFTLYTEHAKSVTGRKFTYTN